MVTAMHSMPAAAGHFEEPAHKSWPGLATGVLDLLRDGVLVLGRDAKPLGMNRSARALLREGDGLVLASGRVVASTPHATMALLRGIDRASQGEVGRMQVPRPGRTPLSLRVEPLPEDARGAAAVVFATDHELRSARRQALIARYGLTPTEAIVACRLAAGADLEQIGCQLDISINTVRGHLKQIFVKTRTHRQVELVCKLLSEA